MKKMNSSTCADIIWLLQIIMTFSMAQWLHHLSKLSPKCFKKESRWVTGPCPSHITLKDNWRNTEFYRVQIGKIGIPLFTYKNFMFPGDWAVMKMKLPLRSSLTGDAWLLNAAETKSTGSAAVVTHSEPTLTSDVSIFLLGGNPAAFACEAASVNARSVNQTGVQTHQLTFRPSSTSLSAPPCSSLSLTTHHRSCQPNMFILTPKVNSIYPPNACPWTGGGSRNTRREPAKVRSDRKDSWRLLLRGKRKLTFYDRYSGASASPEVLRKIITSSFYLAAQYSNQSLDLTP